MTTKDKRISICIRGPDEIELFDELKKLFEDHKGIKTNHEVVQKLAEHYANTSPLYHANKANKR